MKDESKARSFRGTMLTARLFFHPSSLILHPFLALPFPTRDGYTETGISLERCFARTPRHARWRRRKALVRCFPSFRHALFLLVPALLAAAFRADAWGVTGHRYINGLAIDEWNDLDIASQANKLKRYTDHNGTKVTIGNHSPGKPELARRVQPVA